MLTNFKNCFHFFGNIPLALNRLPRWVHDLVVVTLDVGVASIRRSVLSCAVRLTTVCLAWLGLILLGLILRLIGLVAVERSKANEIIVR